MFETSDDYKEKVLADGTQHLLKVYIDGNKIEDKYILEFKMSLVLNESDEFSLGSTPARTVNLKIYKDALPDSYERFYVESGIEGEVVPIGYFNVDEISKDDDFTVSFTLIDDMSKFEFNYDGSELNYPITILEVLQDICEKAGIELSSTSFLNHNKEISVYDNTITARTYISYIAEQAGGFAIINREGKLEIKTIEIKNNFVDFTTPSATSSNTKYTIENGFAVIESSNPDSVTNPDVQFVITNIFKENAGKTLVFACDDYDFSEGYQPRVQLKITYNDGTSNYWYGMVTNTLYRDFSVPEDTSNVSSAMLRFLARNNTSDVSGYVKITITNPRLYFKEDVTELELRKFSDFSWGENFKVSRIAYEDGIQDFKKGDETNNTIWISSDNMYIVDQEQIDNIYEQYKIFDVYSFSGTSIVDPAWDIGDIITIDNKNIVYQGEIEYKGKFKANIESDIQAKSKEDTTTTTTSTSTRIRRVQSQIDTIEGEITQLIQESDDLSEAISKQTQTIEEITSTVSSVEVTVGELDDTVSDLNNNVNDLNDDVKSLSDDLNQNYYTKTETDSQIKQTADNITSTVSNIETTVGSLENNIIDLGGNLTEISNNLEDLSDDLKENYYTKTETTSQIEQTASAITEKVEQNTSDINSVSGELETQKEQIASFELSLDEIVSTVELFENFTNEKEDTDVLYLSDVAGGEGYIISFIIYGNTNNFTSKTIKIVSSERNKGDGEQIYLTTEDGVDLTTESGEELVVGDRSFYLGTIDLTLNDILRSYTSGGTTYYDTLEIAQDGTIQVTRRIGVNSSGNLYLLTEEEIEEFEETFVIPTLEEQTYLFIEELSNITYYAKYITKNDYSDAFLNKLELGTTITQNPEYIRYAWNQLSQYIQFEGIDDNASMNIYNENNNLLLSLNREGQTFYDDSGAEIGKIGVVQTEDSNILAFEMPVDWENIDSDNRQMAWGITDPDGQFLPIFYLAGYYGAENSEYGGALNIAGDLSTSALQVDLLLNLARLTASISWDGEASIYTSNNITLGCYTLIFSSGALEFWAENETIMHIYNERIEFFKPFWIKYSTNGGYVGYPMAGVDSGEHNYGCRWTGSELYFYVDATYIGVLSDERLKTDIKDIDDKFLDAINELHFKQFKIDNRNGLISFGVMAQELIAVFEKYELNAMDYEILNTVQYKMEDETKYYVINYEQFLILKQLSHDRQVLKQQEEIEQLKKEKQEQDILIQDLLKRLEKLEEEK